MSAHPARPLGVAVIGAGMAGRAHLAGYRAASTLAGGAYGEGLPPIPLIAVADAHEPFAVAAAQRGVHQRALARPGDAGDDDEHAEREVDVHVAQVVLRGAPDLQRAGGRPCRRLEPGPVLEVAARHGAARA